MATRTSKQVTVSPRTINKTIAASQARKQAPALSPAQRAANTLRAKRAAIAALNTQAAKPAKRAPAPVAKPQAKPSAKQAPFTQYTPAQWSTMNGASRANATRKAWAVGLPSAVVGGTPAKQAARPVVKPQAVKTSVKTTRTPSPAQAVRHPANWSEMTPGLKAAWTRKHATAQTPSAKPQAGDVDVAKFSSHCPACPNPINPGDAITHNGKRWAHTTCASQADESAKPTVTSDHASRLVRIMRHMVTLPASQLISEFGPELSDVDSLMHTLVPLTRELAEHMTEARLLADRTPGKRSRKQAA